MMMYKGPIEKACQKVKQYIVIGHHSSGLTKDKSMAEKAYRHHNKLIVNQFKYDPEAYDEECFEAPTLTSWDLW